MALKKKQLVTSGHRGYCHLHKDSFRAGDGHLSRKATKLVNFDALDFAIFSSQHFYY